MPIQSTQESINRRRQLAAALQEQSMLPIDMPNYPGAQVSPLQGYAKIAQALFGALGQRKLDKEQSALDEKTTAERTASAQALMQALGVQPELAGAAISGDPAQSELVKAIVAETIQGRKDAAGRQYQTSERVAGQDFSAGQAQTGREFQAQQAQLGREATSANQNIDPLSPLGIQAQLQLQQTRPETPRNIDPLSPEGIAAQVQLAQQRPQAPREERLVQVMGPNGTPIWVRESQAVGQPAAQAARAVTGQERQALAFYNRAKEAVDTLTQSGPNNTDSLEQRIAKSGLASQMQGQFAPNMLQTKDQQSYRQAQRAFTEARLRKESGAAIPAQEFENDAKTYFAQPNDSKQVIEQKRKARQTVLEGLKFSSGKAYEEFYGESGISNPPSQTGTPSGADPLGLFK